MEPTSEPTPTASEPVSATLPPPTGVTHPSSESAAGVNGPFPPELAGWNWGAFFLNWIWGIGNNVWIALLAFVPFVGIVMPFVLGAKGNEWAWQHRKFDNVEQFRAVQKAWSGWGLAIFVVSIVISVALAAFVAFMVAQSPDATSSSLY